MSSTLTVLYFAAARERAGVSREELPWAGGSCAQLLTELESRHPALTPLRPHLRVAVNRAFASMDTAVDAGAEVALIPPVAGGAGLFALVDRPLQFSEVVDAVSDPSLGGLVTFSGAVRSETKGRSVVRLEYEAYGEMVREMLAQIGFELEAEHPGTRVAIVHRVGTLFPGDLAVVIAAAAAHRQAAFAACEQAINRLKRDAPIWKKEVFADGEVWVGLGP